MNYIKVLGKALSYCRRWLFRNMQIFRSRTTKGL